VGGGPGDFINILRFHYRNSVLIEVDYSEGMLLEARDLANSESLYLLRATADRLPLRDKSIRVLHTKLLSTSLDGVTENFNWERYVREADRILIPGNFYIIGEPQARYGIPFLDLGYKIINGHDEPTNGAILQKPF
jgi:ubiquinone/menaquinone biosynthesis C-methylase UbiE